MHDFSTNDLSAWSGDVADFIVNDNEELQLNAPEAGESYIYRQSTINFDTVTIDLYHNLDFSPSDNNKSRIYLAMDNQDPTVANGYFIEIGENGSDDALKFFYLENGVESIIASAAMGAMATEPAVVRLQIDIYPNGLWSVKTNYEGGEFTSLELEFMEDRFSMKDSQYFGLSCKFSASRADKFFYDDMGIQRFVRDTQEPTIIDASPQGNNEVLVTFSEPVMESEGTNVDNYVLFSAVGNPQEITDIGNPQSISTVGTLGNQFLLSFADDFDPNFDYFFETKGISDLSGNVMLDQLFSFLFAGQPQLGDLYISEILFDPYANGEDFIEVYNGSNKNLELQGITIRNAQKEESRVIASSIVMRSKFYVALSKEVDFLIQEYKPPSGANIEFQDLPAFNNDEGNVMLINAASVVLDSFDYNEDLHFQLIDDTEGVSLERVSFSVETNNSRNWQSAAKSVRFATPGYNNSATIPSISALENFEIKTETFSPNQDGDDDQMILSYDLDKTGYTANFAVYDAAGFKIKELSNNELLGTEGIITWDGTNEEGTISDLGIYIIVGNVFHSDGEVLNVKLTVVLADFID